MEENMIKTNKIPHYDELLESMENVAQEDTLVSGITQILDAISGITIDSIEAKQLIVNAINNMGGSATTEMTWIQLSQQIENLPIITMSGLAWTSGIEIESVQKALELRQSNLVSLDDESITSISTNYAFAFLNALQTIKLNGVAAITGNYAFANDTLLSSAELNNVKIISGSYTFQDCTALADIHLDSLETLQSNYTFANVPAKNLNLPALIEIIGGRPFTNSKAEVISMPILNKITDVIFFVSSTTKILSMPSIITATGVRVFEDANRLIDITCGENLTTNFSFLSTWSPTEALRSDVATLVETGETFTNNLEKLLYNIREHIAANLNPNITATITFSSAILNAINNNPDTLAAFPSSWTLAS